MGKLIKSEAVRMSKALCFKIYMIFSAAFGIIMAWSEYLNVERMTSRGFDVNGSVEGIAYSGCITILLAGTVFTGMFIGREYSDGAVRNKLVVGHGRCGIYLTNYILCAAANVAAILINLTAVFAIGLPLLGTNMTAGETAVLIIVTVIAVTAVTSVFVFISMLVKSKAAALTILIFGATFMFGISSFIDSRLKEPEYYSGQEYVITEDGNTEVIDHGPMKNHLYIDGDKRKVFEFFDAFLPSSQLYHTAGAKAPSLAKSAIYDIIVILAVTEAGILLFRKKDIK